MMKVKISQIKWGNIVAPPPDGLPMVLAEQVVVENKGGYVPMYEIEDLYKNHKPPRGYSLYWGVVQKPIESRSNEFRKKIRIRKLVERELKKHPLFADEFIKESLSDNPDYYSGYLDPEQIEFRREIELEYKRYLEIATHKPGLVIYENWFD